MKAVLASCLTITIVALLTALTISKLVSRPALAWAGAEGRAKALSNVEEHACQGPAAERNPNCPKSLGPTHFAGRVRALVVRPDDPNTIWAATASGGLWVTHDAGSTWSHASDVMRTLAFSSLAIDPQNPNVMYAGSGEIHMTLHALDASHTTAGSDAGFTLRSPRRGAGIFKTTDGGTHWNELSNTTLSPDFFFVSRIAVSPQNSNIVLAATSTGLWRSIDGGTNWALANKRVTLPLGGTLVVPLKGVFLDVKFHSHDPANVIAAGLDGQVFFATDGGVIFNPSNLPAAPAGVPAIPTRIELAFLRSEADVWFALELFSKNSGEDPMVVLRSTNGGASFAIRSNPVVIPCGNNRLYSGALFVSDFGTNVFVGGTELCRSDNGGVTFTPVFGSDIHNDNHSIVRGGNDILGNGTIFIGNDGGVFRILDPSRLTFTSPVDAAVLNLNNGLVNQQFQGAAMNPSGIIVGGAQDIGTLHRDTNGVWTELFGGPGGSDGPPTAADPTENDLFYFGKSVARLYRSAAGGGKQCIAGVSGFPLLDMHDDGPACSPRNPPGCNPLGPTCKTLATARCLGPNPMVLDPNDPNILYVGCERLWVSGSVKSAAIFVEWRVIKDVDVTSPDEVLISAIALAPSDRNVMWIGTLHTSLKPPGDLWMTTQLQAPRFTLLNSWKKITDPILPARPVSGVAVHPTDTSRVFVSYSGWASALVTTPSHNLFRGVKGADGNFHFTDISAGLPPGPVYSVALNAAGRIAAGTEFGVRLSSDGGSTWSLAGPRVAVAGTTWTDTHHLLVASYGRGVFVLTL